MVIPTAVAAEAIERYGFVSIGRTPAIVTQFFAITAERRLAHPAIVALTSKVRGPKREHDRRASARSPKERLR